LLAIPAVSWAPGAAALFALQAAALIDGKRDEPMPTK
jgi:hypothetical protein